MVQDWLDEGSQGPPWGVGYSDRLGYSHRLSSLTSDFVNLSSNNYIYFSCNSSKNAFRDELDHRYNFITTWLS